MYQWQPGKWFQLAIVGVGLPFIAAVWFSTDSLVSDISTRAAAAIGGDWAKTEFDVRDATLTGVAATQEAMDSAIKAVLGTYGVRLVKTDGLSLANAAPVPPAAPAIVATTAMPDIAPEIKGTWPEGTAKTLDVTVNGKTYSLGKDAELTSSSGQWDLKLPEALPAGNYDITAVAGDGASASTPAAPAQLVVAESQAQPQILAKPTLITPAANAAWPFAISGTWPEGPAKTLSVGLAGTTYVLGKNTELTSDGKGNFTLQPPADLKPGSYDLDVTASNDQDQTITVNFPGAVVVPPAAPPAAPTVVSVISDSDHPTITGTWPIAASNKFQVEIDGVIHTLGQDADLTSDPQGQWALTPEKPIVNGTYDVIAKMTAADGQSTIVTAKGALTVNVAAPPPVPPASEPYDCVSALAKIAAVYPIRFEFDHADLGPQYQSSLKQYSDLLNDPRCSGLKVQVAGHADYKGPAAYNLALSLRRARTVVAALIASKVDGGQLSSIGFGATRPLDPLHTDDARAKNRRVEFSIQK